MTVLTGRGISPGYADGTALIHEQALPTPVVQRSLATHEVDGELARLGDALATARCELENVERREPLS
jgi:phosphoenolpyruvate-protein kinase (PTS system EI component)